MAVSVYVIASAILTIFSDEASASRLTASPPIRIKYLKYGEAFGITCSPDSTSAAVDLKWYGPNNYHPAASEPNLIKSRAEMPVVDGDRPRIYTLMIGTGLKLFITGLQSIDTGMYNCTGRVNNIPSYWNFELQAYVGLVVNAPPQQILIYQEDSVLECEVKSNPAPEAVWLFENDVINPLENPEKYETSPGGLTVKDVTYADGGEYECVGSVPEGETIVQSISVDVVSKPVMTTPPVNTSGIAYRDARLFCSASSTPPPTYKWYLASKESSSGRDVSDLERFRVSPHNGDMTIINVQVDDEQWYWCEASNRAGKVEGRAHFEVQVFPVFSDSVNLNKTETREGGTVEMICQSEAKPNAKMAFQREGSSQPYVNGYQQDDQRIYVYEKSSPAQVENQLIIPQEVVIRINATTPNDTGNYTCLAENSAGKNQTQMHIIVQHKPNCDLMIPEMFTQCIWEDEPRNVTVLVSGYPQPAVSWSRGAGRPISPDESAFTIFFEPYWENGRPDEWMANLEINWKVTKDGIQGPYAPTGNYFASATNNVGSTDSNDCIINVVEANFPERVSSVNVTARTPREITLSAEPPVEENCIPVIAFEIIYSKHGTNDFEESLLYTLVQRHEMKLSHLEAAVSYSIQVYARNQRGRGIAPNSLIVSTKQSTAPGVVSIISDSTAFSSQSHQVIWRRPDDGGEEIKNYVISWRKVGATKWESRESFTGSSFFSIVDLKPDTTYEVMVQARTGKGLSPEPSPLPTFRTLSRSGSVDSSGRDVSAASSRGDMALELHYIIIIALLILLAVLVAVDMICFCSINRGVLALICNGVGSYESSKERECLPLEGDLDMSRSQASLGPSILTKPKVEKSLSDKAPSHEYINTARLQPNRPAAPQRTFTNARPIDPPRVPSNYSSQQPHHQYRPTASPRPMQNQQVNQEDDMDYHERLRYVPAPRRAPAPRHNNRSTMI